jgi:hypothetical protein
MSVRRADVRLWSLLPRLLLGAFALGACRDDSAREPTVRHLDQGSVSGTIGETAFQRVVLVVMRWERLCPWPRRAPTTMWTAWC